MPLTYSGFSEEGPRGQQTLLMQASQGLLMKLCQPAFALFIYTRYFTWARCCIWNSKLKKRNISQSTIKKKQKPKDNILYSTFLWYVSKFLTDYNKALLSIICPLGFTKAVQSSVKIKMKLGPSSLSFHMGPDEKYRNNKILMINFMWGQMNRWAILKTFGLDRSIEEFCFICYKQICQFVMQMFTHENHHLGFLGKPEKKSKVQSYG